MAQLFHVFSDCLDTNVYTVILNVYLVGCWTVMVKIYVHSAVGPIIFFHYLMDGLAFPCLSQYSILL